MEKNKNKIIFKSKKHKTLLITAIFFLILFFNANFFDKSAYLHQDNNNNFEALSQYDQDLEIANGESTLFQGFEAPLVINDTGNLFKLNQEITVTNQEELNTSYYLDDVNNWKVSRIETSIKNLQDTRNWINNSEFQPIQVFRKNQTFECAHPYANVRTAYLNEEHTIQEDNAIYMRVHFVNISFDYKTDATDSDFMYVYNGSWYEHFVASGYREDFYSPWVNGVLFIYPMKL